ncbi:MAG: DUF1987 domain-containing protein [Bacteroidales bacterium]|nr:DUF1987 domain-containing protein [Bacteroidales bacterium]
METFVIKGTLKTPAVIFNPDGNLIIKGKSIPESVFSLYAPAIQWLEELNTEHVIFNVDLEYINSASKVMLLELFRVLEANSQVKTIRVNWHFDADDEDSYDTGKIFEESLTRSRFTYVDYVTS